MPIRNNYIVLLLAFLLTLQLNAAEPTTPASNIVVNNANVDCKKATISWTNGNGTWRLVLVKEGSAVDGAPGDGTKYTAYNTFADGSQIGTGNYVCFNSLTNSFVLSNLKPKTTYHIAVFEHDGDPTAPDYLTTNPAVYSFTTKYLDLKFSFTFQDSCQNTNVIQFKNETTTDLTGITYTWDFKDNSGTVNGFDVSHTYTKGGYFTPSLLALPSGGCVNNTNSTKQVLIIPRPKSDPKERDGKYVQCFTGNHFYFEDKTTLDFVPRCALRGFWYFGVNDSSTFPMPDREYKAPGSYKVYFRSETLYDGKYSGCTDLDTLLITVVEDRFDGATVDDTVQCLASNKFKFDDVYPNLVAFHWDFDDGNSSTSKSVDHTYGNVGTYEVIHQATSPEGCKGNDTLVVLVKPNTISNYTGLPSSVCEGADPIHLTPNRSGGVWKGPGMVDSVFNPLTTGKVDIQHIIPDEFCPDTTTKTIDVIALPKFSLGTDAVLCNGGTQDLNVATTGTLIWDDGSSNAARTVIDAGDYWAEVTENGCSWRDSIKIYIGTTPQVVLGLDTSLCKGSVLQLSAEWAGSTILWNNGSTASSIYVTNPGLYSVTVTNPCGSATDDIKVHFQGDFCDVFIPDAFTPNGDNKNEFYEIQGKAIIPKLFIVYDRWGAVVFDSRASNIHKWDGYHNGIMCGDGMYSYLFRYEVIVGDFTRKNTIKGSFLLYR